MIEMCRLRPGVRIGTVVLGVALLAACGARKSFLNENDRLRARVLELEQQIDALTSRQRELEAELAQAAAATDSAPEQIRAATPRVASIVVDGRSHARDVDGDGVADMLLLYVKPRDGLGRFVQLVGKLTVHAAVLPPGDDAVSIGRVRLDPQELRDAYRSGFMGTHYTIELPIDVPEGLGAERCLVRVIFEDGWTGLTRSAERGVQLSASPGPAGAR